MSSKIRALTAALIVVAVALAGALYFGYRSGLKRRAEHASRISAAMLQASTCSPCSDRVRPTSG